MAISKNIQNVRFLRNNGLFESREAAISGLNRVDLSVEKDGTIVLARYGSGSNVKTLAGLVYFASNDSKSITIIDVEGASGEVADLRAEIEAKLGSGITSANTASDQLAALSGNNQSTSADTSVEGAKKYADQILSAAIDSFEYTGVTTGDGKVVVNVRETDGVISGVTAEVGGLKLTDYSKGSDSGAVASTDTINQAVSKLEKQIDAEKDARAAAISGLDKSDSAVAKNFVTAVSEEDGIINVSRGTISSSAETIVLTDNADGGVNFEVNIDNNTIIQDAETKKLKVADAALVQYEGDGDTIQIGGVSEGKRIVSSLLTISATTPSEANVKEQYNLVGASGNTIGATIKIYKDSALLSVALLHADTTSTPQVLPTYNKATNSWTDIAESAQTAANQALCYAYEDVSGNTVVAAVPVGSFINEQEFASGVTWDVTENKVRGVVDSTSESFLTVGAGGFKLSGVQDAIDAAVADLDAVVTGGTTAGTATSNHIQVVVGEADGKLTGVTVTETNIANADDLATLSGKTITEVESSNASISATTATTDSTVKVDVVTDASKIKMTGFTAAKSGFTAITSASTVTEAVKAVETEMIANEQTTASALVDLDARIKELSGGSATDLAAEIAARKAVDGIDGSAYTATLSAHYISNATSLNDADQKLDDALNTVSGDLDTVKTNYVRGVSVNGKAVTVSDHVAPISITAATAAATATSTEAIVVNTDANGHITLGLADLDAGTYDPQPQS